MVRLVLLVVGALLAGTFTAPAAHADGYPPSISGSPYPGQVGERYGFGFTLDGDPAPTTSLAAGDLPPGLELSTDGVLAGTPRTAGSFTFTVEASNGEDPDATLDVTVRIEPGEDTSTPPSLRGSPPDAVAGERYGFGFTVDGDPTPTVSLASGTLPPGLTVSTDGVLGGVPTQDGPFRFTVQADNGVGQVATLDVALTVEPAPTSPPDITGTPPDAVVGTVYGFAFEMDGAPTPTVTLSAGALPPGLVLSTDGILSGTPQTAGTYTFSVRAANGVDPAAVQAVSIDVAPDPQAVRFTSTPQTGAAVGGTYTPTAEGTGSSSPVVIAPTAESQSVCTIYDAGIVSFIKAGVCTLVATQAGDDDFPDARPATQSFRVANGKVPQTIAFTSNPPSPALVGERYLAMVRGGGSVAPVVFSQKSSSARVCTVGADGQVAFLAPGRCTIYARQAGDDRFRPAPRITQVVVVSRK